MKSLTLPGLLLATRRLPAAVSARGQAWEIGAQARIADLARATATADERSIRRRGTGRSGSGVRAP